MALIQAIALGQVCDRSKLSVLPNVDGSPPNALTTPEGAKMLGLLAIIQSDAREQMAVEWTRAKRLLVESLDFETLLHLEFMDKRSLSKILRELFGNRYHPITANDVEPIPTHPSDEVAGIIRRNALYEPTEPISPEVAEYNNMIDQNMAAKPDGCTVRLPKGRGGLYCPFPLIDAAKWGVAEAKAYFSRAAKVADDECDEGNEEDPFRTWRSHMYAAGFDSIDNFGLCPEISLPTDIGDTRMPNSASFGHKNHGDPMRSGCNTSRPTNYARHYDPSKKGVVLESWSGNRMKTDAAREEIDELKQSIVTAVRIASKSAVPPPRPIQRAKGEVSRHGPLPAVEGHLFGFGVVDSSHLGDDLSTTTRFPTEDEYLFGFGSI